MGRMGCTSCRLVRVGTSDSYVSIERTVFDNFQSIFSSKGTLLLINYLPMRVKRPHYEYAAEVAVHEP